MKFWVILMKDGKLFHNQPIEVLTEYNEDKIASRDAAVKGAIDFHHKLVGHPLVHESVELVALVFPVIGSISRHLVKVEYKVFCMAEGTILEGGRDE